MASWARRSKARARRKVSASTSSCPSSSTPNEVIRHDPKLVTFRYFFTRKLTFLREANAVAAFPGGFGTLDEALEVITLMQTGKARLIPLVLVDQPGGTFWKNFTHYVSEHLMGDKLISPEDFNLFKLTRQHRRRRAIRSCASTAISTPTASSARTSSSACSAA